MFIREFVGWCALINIGTFAVWVLALIAAGDWVYSIHSKWFKITKEQFYIIHYALIGFYKLSIFMFFLVPYLLIRNLG